MLLKQEIDRMKILMICLTEVDKIQQSFESKENISLGDITVLKNLLAEYVAILDKQHWM